MIKLTDIGKHRSIMGGACISLEFTLPSDWTLQKPEYAN